MLSCCEKKNDYLINYKYYICFKWRKKFEQGSGSENGNSNFVQQITMGLLWDKY